MRLQRMVKASESHSHEGVTRNIPARYLTSEAELRAKGMCIRCTTNEADASNGMCVHCEIALGRHGTRS
jgi:hypothetical protein